jgi:hypothetical protein
MVGSLDDRFTTRINLPEIPFGADSVLAYLKTPVNRFLVCESLSPTYTKNNTVVTNSFLFSQPLNSSNSNRYIFTLVKGLEHQFPNGVNFPLVVADLHWEFFKQSIATDVKEIRLPNSAVNIFPNPSNTEMTLDLSAFTEGVKTDLTVYNTVGQLLFFIKNQDSPLTIVRAFFTTLKSI